MTNIDKLNEIGILGDIRQRLGAEDENDTKYDARINRMDNDDIMRAWSGWEIGDEQWWVIMKRYWDSLERMDRETLQDMKELINRKT